MHCEGIYGAKYEARPCSLTGTYSLKRLRARHLLAAETFVRPISARGSFAVIYSKKLYEQNEGRKCRAALANSFSSRSSIKNTAMAPSQTKRKDTAGARHRSHKGCWTCKRKRVQCDETRPGCQRCSSRGVVCEGYEIRLRWGAGIASRGRYSGAEKPVKEFIPPPSKRRWDLRDKGEQGDGDRQGQPVLLFRSSSYEGTWYHLQNRT